MRVGFAGAGNMAAAIARGWHAGEGGAAEMLFTDAGSGAAARLAEEVGGRAVAGNAELAAQSDLVILAVKPAQLEAVAAELGGATRVLSLLAATPLDRLQAALPSAAIIRAMPNVGVEVRRGVICLAAPDDAKDLLRQVTELLAPLGEVIRIEDRGMDAATAVMSCSPAYVALIAETLAEAGAREGLDERLSYELVVETLAGTAELLRKHDPLNVRRAVTSPGGSTAAGLAALDRGGARASFEDAVQASLQKMRTA
ncbi:MAG: pyrroline-5-carboxylate reductase [Solirubrobacterales bacterium]|jgi:pyrroline-5-carboxylate reductase|nr:pyrroline-5-carboxylate reductase [Solirubrobacterales bacterium]